MNKTEKLKRSLSILTHAQISMYQAHVHVSRLFLLNFLATKESSLLNFTKTSTKRYQYTRVILVNILK